MEAGQSAYRHKLFLCLSSRLLVKCLLLLARKFEVNKVIKMRKYEKYTSCFANLSDCFPNFPTFWSYRDLENTTGKITKFCCNRMFKKAQLFHSKAKAKERKIFVAKQAVVLV